MKGKQIRDIALTIKAEEILIATDDDEEGNSFFSTFKAQNPSLKTIGIGISGTYKDNSFTGKDWNEFLVYRKNKKKGLKSPFYYPHLFLFLCPKSSE